jgi:hypothetical protein
VDRALTPSRISGDDTEPDVRVTVSTWGAAGVIMMEERAGRIDGLFMVFASWRSV